MKNENPNEFVASLFEQEFDKELVRSISERNKNIKILEKLLEDFNGDNLD